jgi:hypothetical protein
MEEQKPELCGNCFSGMSGKRHEQKFRPLLYARKRRMVKLGLSGKARLHCSPCLIQLTDVRQDSRLAAPQLVLYRQLLKQSVPNQDTAIVGMFWAAPRNKWKSLCPNDSESPPCVSSRNDPTGNRIRLSKELF